ncbi:MAG TPA: cytochrome c [Rubrivivax sp.]|nr:cytochrome c [Rubrivivax sp.]
MPSRDEFMHHPFRSFAPLVLAAAAATAQSAPPPGDPMPGDFTVVDGRVDAGTFAGWRLFQTHCQSCHGIGGVGTAVAPNLVERIRNYAPRGFATKVLSSYRIARLAPDDPPPDSDTERTALLEEVMKRERSARGQPLMPAWDGDGAVTPHVLDLYAYLNARADGGLGPGRPGLLPPARRQP